MSSPTCTCIEEINRLLKNDNAQLVGTLLLTSRGRKPDPTAKIIVATETNGETVGRHKFQPVMLSANFCPFCGVAYPSRDDAVTP